MALVTPMTVSGQVGATPGVLPESLDLAAWSGAGVQACLRFAGRVLKNAVVTSPTSHLLDKAGSSRSCFWGLARCLDG